MPLACFIVSTRPVPPPIQLQACGVYLPFFPLLLLPQPFSAISPHVAHPLITCPFPLSPAMSLPATPLLTILCLLHHFSPSEWGTKFTVRLFLNGREGNGKRCPTSVCGVLVSPSSRWPGPHTSPTCGCR